MSNKLSTGSAATDATNLPLSRLCAYLAIGLSIGALATTTEAAVIPIDVSGISAVNGGAASGGFVPVENWPTSGAGRLLIFNGYSGAVGLHLGSAAPGGIASDLSNASVRKFGAGSLIDSTTGGVANYQGGFYPTAFAALDTSVPDFGPDSFLGFKDKFGRYGYIEVTWSATSRQFQVLSAAYESVAGVGITTPSGAAVPEPDSNTLAGTAMLAMGSVAMLERRRRKRAAAATAEAAA
jgi:hypothetical protein